MLSPVSKLERARQMSILDQRRRIEAACEAKVTRKKETQLKRKFVGKALESHIKKKVKKDVDFEPVVPILRASRSTSRSKQTSRRSSSSSSRRPRMAEGEDIAAVMHSTSSSTGMSSRATPPTPQTVFSNSQRQFSEQQRPEKPTIRAAGEGATAFAIRAAGERRRQREAIKQQAAATSLLTTITYHQHEPEEEQPQGLSLADDGSSEEQERTEEEEDTVGAREFATPSPRSSNTTTCRRASYWSTLQSLWMGLAIVLVVGGYFWVGEIQRNAPYCDSDSPAGASNSFGCSPCPTHGTCLEGELMRCQKPYVLFAGQCAESDKLQRDGQLMFEELRMQIARLAETRFCTLETFEEPTTITSGPSTSVSMLALKQQLLQQNAVWRSSPRDLFEATFEKATKLLKQQGSGVEVVVASAATTSDGTATGEVHLTLQSAPVWCQGAHLAYRYKHHLTTLLLLLLGSWMLQSRRVRKSKEQQVCRDLLSHAQDALIDVSQHSASEFRGYALDHLRDHVLDWLEYTGDERIWVQQRIWPQVIESMSRDSRVRGRLVQIRGQQTTYWEWISPMLEKSAERRRGKTPELKKQLDFNAGTPGPTSFGQPVGLL